jgi:hypothetical protein
MRTRYAFAKDTDVLVSGRTGRVFVVDSHRKAMGLAAIDRVAKQRQRAEQGQRLVEQATTALAESKGSTRTHKATGWAGTERQGGVIYDEHKQSLKYGAWRGDGTTIGVGKRLWREDGEFRAATNALIMPHMVNGWHMEEADPDDPDARMLAHAAQKMMIDDPRWRYLQWDRFLCVRDGVRLQEKQVSFDPDFFAPDWTQDETLAGSPWVKGNGGRTGWYVVELFPRLPHTVEEWITNPDGSFGGIKQIGRFDDSGNAGQRIQIDAEDLLRWTYAEEGTNWNGDPTGRAAWGMTQLRKDIVTYLGIGASRWAVGTPVVKETQPDTLDDEDWDELQVIAEQYSVHQTQFLEVPYGADMTILEAEMKTGDLLWSLYDGLGRAMHRLFGTMHIYSGEGYGSRSEFEAKFDSYLLNIQDLGMLVVAPINELLADWTEWNGFARDMAPKLTHDDLKTKTGLELAEMVKAAKDAGLYTRQIDDEVRWREVAMLPALTMDALEEKTERTPDFTPTDAEPGDADLDDDEEDDPDALSTCDCGHHALADDIARHRVFRPHPGRAAAMAHAAALGPLHALAEETFDAGSSRSSREARMMTMADGIGPFVEEITEKIAGELEGQTIGKAAGVKLKDADLVPMRQYIARQLKLTQRNAADEVKREQREQREDPSIAKRFADAIEQVQEQRNDPTAFATIASRAGIEATNDLEQLDFDDYIRGAAKAAADNIATKIQSAARAAVQTAAAAGGATMDAIRAAVAVAVTPQVLLGEIQAPVQGTYSIGRETQLKREDVALILYTNTPELSSQVCDVCLDTAASPDNPYPANDTALDAVFQTPNPGCLGALAGRGNPCWCARIGITGAASPEDIRRAV